MASVFSDPRFQSEEAAYAWVEARLWPHGPVCPHCGAVDNAAKLAGKSTRVGVHKCRGCRKPFRVTVGTVMEASHIKLHIWLQALHLMTCSKKGISSNQLHRVLGLGLRAAWFLSHRIREAMRSGDLPPLGGNGGVVEADETYFGNRENPRPRRSARAVPPPSAARSARAASAPSSPWSSAAARCARSTSRTPTRPPSTSSSPKTSPARPRCTPTRAASTTMRSEHVAEHETVTHSAGEYVRGDVHTNTVEGLFSVFKRGMKGIYQHCAEKHLHRYLAEFDFRHNHRVRLGVNDAMRAEAALLGVVGRRLTYRTAH